MACPIKPLGDRVVLEICEKAEEMKENINEIPFDLFKCDELSNVIEKEIKMVKIANA